MKIISINDGHNASAALMIDGEVIYAIQEERLARIKNIGGFPIKALQDIFSRNSISFKDVDYFVFAGEQASSDMVSRESVIKKYSKLMNVDLGKKKIRIRLFLKKFAPNKLRLKFKQDYIRKIQDERSNFLIKNGVKKNIIRFVEHHKCHAFSAGFGWGRHDEFLVITSDGSGDNISGSINLFQKGEIKRLSSIRLEDSIARLYSFVTYYLGMVPNEHEYKLMGMAPYAYNSKQARNIADGLLSLFQFCDGDRFERKPGIEPIYYIGPRLKKLFDCKRFDYISAGVQIFIEEFTVQWIKNIINKYKIHKIALSGGLFMNVKLNKSISELEEIEDVFVFPSCGDESNVFGALYAIWFELKGEAPKPIKDLYLGGSYDNNYIEDVLKLRTDSKYNYQKCTNIEKKIAELIANKEIVARFKGRMEFGARALGNRSILADASNYNTIKIINSMIKCRDFWMPFAPSMIDTEKYLVNKKGLHSPYMMFSFKIKPEKSNFLPGAMHLYDESCRPNEVMQDWNPSYYKLIKEFEKITKESVVLNTSFNLHGFPIVYTPEDALFVFENSGLKFLAIEDFLITK